MQKEKLCKIRKQKGYTQQQLADFMSTNVSNYSRKETGNVKITKEEWEKISKFLGVSIEEIYENEETEEPKGNTNKAIGVAESASNNDLNVELIKNLLDYIALLKEENRKLKESII
ncbi:hypothetical protein BBI01_11665 [Chryseobacterium artocarpi]|uniref:HTH cro/C1-type domain-containing protein n=1 Tax=Chryseobacterium artocarpi TaxID=1414727 RepID=A0A1B8ZHE0_9FLAO|nr:hypothetical protein BBI01_11665 [Chryseobacterium artocarpi]